MTRAGKEPAEDVKRAFRRAIQSAGLKARQVRMNKSPYGDRRLVLGHAEPEGWPHETPAITMYTAVDFTGDVHAVQVQCSASDEACLKDFWEVPVVQNCSCRMEDLPETLQALWAERQVVMDLLKRGVLTLPLTGRWVWAVPNMGG
ncbi:MAG: hypothetical protein NT031_19220 [Planctomycetota bacterium]|nr:hypothetical protein [Planctomycetota bacterium]